MSRRIRWAVAIMLCVVAIAGCSPSFTTGGGDIAFTYPFPLSQLSFRIRYNVQNPSLSGLNSCYFDTQSGAFVPMSQLWHTGEDWFPTSHNTPIVAVANGTVKYVSPSGYSYPGAVVIIQHDLPDGTTIYSMYGHLDPAMVLVSAGQQVREGQQIARRLLPQTYQGNDNTHLHWEIRYFFDASGIKEGPDGSRTCSAEPGPGYTWPGHPDNFTSGGITYRWTNPSQFVAAHGGEAFSGGALATPTFTSVPATPTSTSTPSRKVIHVSPLTTPPGVDTGIAVTPGQIVTITASGLAQYGGDSGSGCGTNTYPYTDPDGNRFLSPDKTQPCPPKIDSGATGPDAPIGALLARIGTSGDWFAVGSKDTFPVSDSGELYLVYNDSYYDDNSQTQYYIVHISVQ